MLENEISRYAGNLVGGMTSTYTGQVTINPMPALHNEDGTTTMLTEVGVILSSNKGEDYDSGIGAEEFSLSGGTLNSDGSGTYDQVTRGIANNSVGVTPGGHVNWQTSHQDGAPVIIDPTYKLRALDNLFKATTTELQGVAGEVITGTPAVPVPFMISTVDNKAYIFNGTYDYAGAIVDTVVLDAAVSLKLNGAKMLGTSLISGKVYADTDGTYKSTSTTTSELGGQSVGGTMTVIVGEKVSVNELTQAQVIDGASTVFGTVSGERIKQAVDVSVSTEFQDDQFGVYSETSFIPSAPVAPVIVLGGGGALTTTSFKVRVAYRSVNTKYTAYSPWSNILTNIISGTVDISLTSSTDAGAALIGVEIDSGSGAQFWQNAPNTTGMLNYNGEALTAAILPATNETKAVLKLNTASLSGDITDEVPNTTMPLSSNTIKVIAGEQIPLGAVIAAPTGVTEVASQPNTSQIIATIANGETHEAFIVAPALASSAITIGMYVSSDRNGYHTYPHITVFRETGETVGIYTSGTSTNSIAPSLKYISISASQVSGGETLRILYQHGQAPSSGTSIRVHGLNGDIAYTSSYNANASSYVVAVATDSTKNSPCGIAASQAEIGESFWLRVSGAMSGLPGMAIGSKYNLAGNGGLSTAGSIEVGTAVAPDTLSISL